MEKTSSFQTLFKNAMAITQRVALVKRILLNFGMLVMYVLITFTHTHNYHNFFDVNIFAFDLYSKPKRRWCFYVFQIYNNNALLRPRKDDVCVRVLARAFASIFVFNPWRISHFLKTSNSLHLVNILECGKKKLLICLKLLVLEQDKFQIALNSALQHLNHILKSCYL